MRQDENIAKIWELLRTSQAEDGKDQKLHQTSNQWKALVSGTVRSTPRKYQLIDGTHEFSESIDERDLDVLNREFQTVD